MIYTIYARENDMTFIMEKEVVEQTEYLSVVGFYFGEPNEADTKEYTNSLTAEFEVEHLRK